jgi:ABC-type lipoprotein export system ATPase subunit
VSLSARSLTKRFGGYDAVRGVDLELSHGEFVSIVGRSGSGKSTLLALLGALARPSEGTLLLDGIDVWSLPEKDLARFRARHIGFIFQFPSLLANLTAVDNIAVPALLGRTMAPEAAYARAYDLVARVGLADRAESYPGTLSGGEQRRVVVARALVNSPRLLLADEPTSDLDEDTEADIIALLKDLRRSESFGLVLVTHNLDLARSAPRIHEMRQGRLVVAGSEVGVAPAPEVRPRRFDPISVPAGRTPIPTEQRTPRRLGADLWRHVRTFLIGGAAAFGAFLLVDFAVAKFQEKQLRDRGARMARLADTALTRLQSEVQSVLDLGQGRYELAIALRNTDSDKPIYVMSPDMHAFVQIGKVWQEVPLQPIEGDAAGVWKIDGLHIERYEFEARVEHFTQLLPNYMHMRFSNTMLVSPSSRPKGDIFERKDNYYVYLKPFDVADEVVSSRMKFSGKPPVWIPMPPH